MEIPETHLLKLQRTETFEPDDDIKAEVNEIMPYLQGVKTILDIGCGIGIAATYLAKAGYEVTAFDRSAFTPPKYGMGRGDEWYNDLSVTRKLFDVNEVDVEIVNVFPASRKFDAAISFYSWGFHYPIELYAPKAPIWVADIRKSAGLPRAWEVIQETTKAWRAIRR